MKKMMKFKKVVLSLTLAMAVLSTGAVAYAAPIGFSLTVNSTGYQQDNLSRRTIKDSGSNYAVVRANSFGGTGTMYVKSIKINNSKIFTGEISLTSGAKVGVDQKAYYNANAAFNEYYYLQGRYGSSSSNSLKVTGMYTP